MKPSRFHRPSGIFFGLLLGACCLTGIARADDVPPASDDLIAQGVALREQRRDAEALLLFRRAQSVSPSPRAAAQIGLAEEALGRYVDAEAALLDALAADGDPWIARYRLVLAGALASVQRHLAWLDVTSSVPGAELRIDGVVVGALPARPQRRVVGVVQVEVRAAGYEPVSRQVTLHSGEPAFESFVLPSIHSPTPPGAADAPPPRPGPRTNIAWITAAGAAAFLAGGAAAQLVRENAATTYDNNRVCQVPGAGTRDAQCGGYHSTADVATALAVTGYSAAALLAGASIFFFLKSPGPRASASTPSCGLAGAGVACSVVF